MVRTTVLAATVSLFLAGTALAGHCPQDAAAIDAYIAVAELDDGLVAEVVALKEEGMQLHEAGNHRDSEAKLAEAMRKLLTAE